jgi:hypothetical protein
MAGDDFAHFVEPGLGVKGVCLGVGSNPESEIENAPPHSFAAGNDHFSAAFCR